MKTSITAGEVCIIEIPGRAGRPRDCACGSVTAGGSGGSGAARSCGGSCGSCGGSGGCNGYCHCGRLIRWGDSVRASLTRGAFLACSSLLALFSCRSLPTSGASNSGWPACASESGRPASACESSRPACASESSRPASACESGRPASASAASGTGGAGWGVEVVDFQIIERPSACVDDSSHVEQRIAVA